jgi:hypothetical protein
VVEETSSDQLELSVGWGSNQFIASVGVFLIIFHLRSFLRKKHGLPSQAETVRNYRLRFMLTLITVNMAFHLQNHGWEVKNQML